MSNNVLIFGDSYSTFEGYIPKGYAPYYTVVDDRGSGVKKVSDTWWHKLITETNSELVLNNSWSGSTICYTGYNNNDCSETSSFIYRLNKLKADGFFEENRIDTVFIFGGTNDSWANAPLGEEKYDSFEKSDLYSVRPAICYFLKLAKETFPSAEIYCLINTEIKDEIIDCLKNASAHYGVKGIAFDIIDKVCGHPTAKGMDDIKNQILAVMNK